MHMQLAYCMYLTACLVGLAVACCQEPLVRSAGQVLLCMLSTGCQRAASMHTMHCKSPGALCTASGTEMSLDKHAELRPHVACGVGVLRVALVGWWWGRWLCAQARQLVACCQALVWTMPLSRTCAGAAHGIKVCQICAGGLPNTRQATAPLAWSSVWRATRRWHVLMLSVSLLRHLTARKLVTEFCRAEPQEGNSALHIRAVV
jgi:hypothetical protein